MPITFFGALGNILTLIIILRARWYATGIQVLILTLTLCGVFSTSVVYPVWWLGTIVDDPSVWQIPGICPITAYVFLSVTCVSSTVCAMIAINRFCIIVIPQQTRRITQKRGGIVMSIVACAISGTTFMFPLLRIDGQFGLIEPLNICIWQQWTASQEFQTAFFLVIYVIPGIVIAACYLGIFLFLRIGHLGSVIHCGGLGLRKVSVCHGTNGPESGRKLRRLLQATKMMGVTFLVYVVCFLPINTMAWWKSDDLYAGSSATIFAWLLLLYTTSDCIHPV